MSTRRNQLWNVIDAYKTLQEAVSNHPLLSLAELGGEHGIIFTEEFFGKYTSRDDKYSFRNKIPEHFDDLTIRNIFAPARYAAALWEAVKEERSKKGLVSRA